jgi:hypothetical protein
MLEGVYEYLFILGGVFEYNFFPVYFVTEAHCYFHDQHKITIFFDTLSYQFKEKNFTSFSN